jgi:F420-dependent oxidoreductase-like protein
MEICVFTEPQQGASYDDLSAVARLTEELGFTGFFRSDHWLKMGSVSGLPGPTDPLVTLGGLARETTRVRLGTLVLSATFRHPGPLAIAAAQIDEMSGGRLELGLGAGWFEAEHRAYGLRFPGLAERFEVLAEQLAILTGLWATPVGETFSYSGAHYELVDSPALPKPAQRPGPPIVIGGGGPRKTAALAARYATEYNRAFVSVETFARNCANVRRACEERGRPPEELRYSSALVLCCGEDEAAVARRAASIGREPAELRKNGAAGTPDEVVDKVLRYRDAGAQRIYLQVLDLADLDHLRLVAAEVAPHLR